MQHLSAAFQQLLLVAFIAFRHMDHADNAVQWCADIMAHPAQKRRLGGIGPPGLLGAQPQLFLIFKFLLLFGNNISADIQNIGRGTVRAAAFHDISCQPPVAVHIPEFIHKGVRIPHPLCQRIRRKEFTHFGLHGRLREGEQQVVDHIVKKPGLPRNFAKQFIADNHIVPPCLHIAVDDHGVKRRQRRYDFGACRHIFQCRCQHLRAAQIFAHTAQVSAYIREKVNGYFIVTLARVIYADKALQAAACKDRNRNQGMNALHLQDLVFLRRGGFGFFQIIYNDRFLFIKLFHPCGQKCDRNILQTVNFRPHIFGAPFVCVIHAVMQVICPVENIDPVCSCIFPDGLQDLLDDLGQVILALRVVHAGNLVQDPVHTLQLDLIVDFAVLCRFSPHDFLLRLFYFSGFRSGSVPARPNCSGTIGKGAGCQEAIQGAVSS